MTEAPLTREQAIKRLVGSEPEIRALGVERLALFGSVARGESRRDGDVNLLVQFFPGEKTYDRLLALSDLLAACLNSRVNLVTVRRAVSVPWPRISGRSRRCASSRVITFLTSRLRAGKLPD